MEEEILEEGTSQNEPVEETPTQNPEPEQQIPEVEKPNALQIQKEKFRKEAAKAKAEAEALRKQLEASKSTLNVEDYIDISASLEGLDQREKSYLATQHKLTGQSLQEIRNSEDFALWQSAYRAKVEKEKSLLPSNAQPESERPRSLTERLRGASLEEKERILAEQGLWKSPRPRTEKRDIGGPFVR